MKAVETLSIALPPIPDAPDARSSTTLASTICSDGKIRVFDLALLPAKDSSSSGERPHLSPLAEYDTKGTRLTCMAIADGEAVSTSTPANGKRKRVVEEEEVSESEAEEDIEEEGEEGEEEENEGDEWEDEEEEV